MIWLVGSGPMSVDYAKILDAQNRDYIVIGRGKASAEEFTNKTGKEMAYRDLEIEDDTGKCSLRVKTGAVSNEYINSIKAESRIELVNVGWLINQKRLTTMKSRFAASDIMLDEEIDKHNKFKNSVD